MSNRPSKSIFIKLLLIGERAVGKTSLMRQYIENKFSDDYKGTMGADFLSKTIRQNEVVYNLQLWDIAGESKYTSFKKYYYSGAQGVLMVFDVTRRETLTKLYHWVENIDRYSPRAVKYLIGNKIDLKDKIVIRQDERMQFEPILGAIGSLETSAKTGENVEYVFLTMANKIREMLRNYGVNSNNNDS
ncbi:MAG: Rab family GTPase [Candidatus Odinarchaeota archaeon]